MAVTTIEPTAASVSGDGEALVLEMESLKDIAFLNNQLVQFGIRHLRRVQQYLERLDEVVDGTEDERIVVAAASVSVNALKAVVAALKAEALKGREGDKHVHFHGPDLSQMTIEELKARLALIREARGADTDA